MRRDERAIEGGGWLGWGGMENSGAEHPLPKPGCEIFLAEIVRGYRLHGSDGIRWIEAQTKSVVGKKEPGRHPSGTFISVGKSVPSRQAVRICGGQGGSIRRLVGCQIPWMRQCRFHAAGIQDAG